MEVVPAVGTAGGLAIFWQDDMNLQVIVKDKRFFHCVVNGNEINDKWFITLIQGPPYPVEKKKFWNLLRDTGDGCKDPWIIAGDFNEILDKGEKWGRKSFKPRKAELCLDFLRKMKMFDIGSVGPTFTWTNRRKGFALIKESVDKAVRNVEWQSIFPEAMVSVLTVVGSDHSPILLTSNPKNQKLPRPFRFHNLWLREEECGMMIKKKWLELNCADENNITKLLQKARI